MARKHQWSFRAVRGKRSRLCIRDTLRVQWRACSSGTHATVRTRGITPDKTIRSERIGPTVFWRIQRMKAQGGLGRCQHTAKPLGQVEKDLPGGPWHHQRRWLGNNVSRSGLSIHSKAAALCAVLGLLQSRCEAA
jgi:hypothetical protein